MASAAWALQQAIFAALSADAELVSLLGGAHIYDDVPTRAKFPYVTFAQAQERDWSSGSEAGGEHILTLNVWSRGRGRKESSEIMSALRDALHDATLVLSGFRLVNLRHELSDARRDPDGETWRGIVRFRAVTEPLV